MTDTPKKINGHDAAPGKGEGNENVNHQIEFKAQYVKDLSFENPNAPEVLVKPTSQPDVEISVNVSAKNMEDEQFEVLLSITAKAKTKEKTLFVAEVSYAAVVAVPGAKPELVKPLVLIETPRLLFPFARAVLANMTREGGFLPLNLHPIDFVALYQANQEHHKKEEAKGEQKKDAG